jgi:hypothetical protein
MTRTTAPIMSHRLKKYAPYLKKLFKIHSSSRKKTLEKHIKDPEFVKCLCECAKNIIKGNVKLTPAQRRKICCRKKLFRKLALKKTSSAERRKIVQKGGFLGVLLGPIISALGGLFGSS